MKAILVTLEDDNEDFATEFKVHWMLTDKEIVTELNKEFGSKWLAWKHI